MLPAGLGQRPSPPWPGGAGEVGRCKRGCGAQGGDPGPASQAAAAVQPCGDPLPAMEPALNPTPRLQAELEKTQNKLTEETDRARVAEQRMRAEIDQARVDEHRPLWPL